VNALIRYVDIIVEYICKFMLLVQLIVVSGVVVGRFVFNVTPAWGEEMALFAMVWFGMLSASIGVREDSHLCLSLFEGKMSETAKKVRDGFVFLMIALFGLFLLVQGINMVELTRNNSLPGMKISSSWLYFAIPTAGVAIIMQVIARVRKSYGSK
jgi:TRAP-type transport system small permease protein